MKIVKVEEGFEIVVMDDGAFMRKSGEYTINWNGLNKYCLISLSFNYQEELEKKYQKYLSSKAKK